MIYMAQTYGGTAHLSPLLRKARKLGITLPDQLLHLAVLRGCRHYSQPEMMEQSFHDPGTDKLSNAELSIALISGAQSWNPQYVRCAAQLMGAPGVDPVKIARLAKMERCVPILRHIAQAGIKNDPLDPSFWQTITVHLPPSPAIPAGRMPHSSRFMIQNGWAPRNRPASPPIWLRPSVL